MKKIIPLMLSVLMLRVWYRSPKDTVFSRETLSGITIQYVFNDNHEFLIVRRDQGTLDYVDFLDVTASEWVEVTAGVKKDEPPSP
jgi:hypothetical protein